MEKVDILEPPAFKKTGKVTTLVEAWENGDWIRTFNLWLVQSDPLPAIVYQQRSPNSAWEPSKLDVTAGGHYQADEEIIDGLREVWEELGKTYQEKDLTYLGRRLNVSFDTKGRKRQNVVEIFMVVDNSLLESFVLQKEEVYAICSCPISELIKVHTQEEYSFMTNALTSTGEKTTIKVSKNSFPYNWDNYLFKIALLAQRFIQGDKYLLY